MLWVPNWGAALPGDVGPLNQDTRKPVIPPAGRKRGLVPAGPFQLVSNKVGWGGTLEVPECMGVGVNSKGSLVLM